MRVEVIVAWPDRYSAVQLELAEGATVAEAVAASGFAGHQALVAQAVHGVIATPAQVLRDGDRVELLRPLLLDPKEARRRRAVPAKQAPGTQKKRNASP
ncbi:RnfH family protein [Xanthomonas campestris pv. campestris]|uniref:RnfH family protein n=1 Tax=Xanthomonas campestris TaxID=339 RepID=UPI002AD4683F|nr:RnfH family protein [Xanthomonas campestris]MEA0735270.1 RnfH family protein [Xanthomonas campestris pv. campestris]MEA9706777.1 RnfH family protein [Xanthomonas campestris pv. raphani]MEA9900755.1 RnfH family protein [Xanthomonas campestris pv. raphani]